MIESLIEGLETATDEGAFETTLSRSLESLGFDRFAYLALRLPESGRVPYVVTTYPGAWAAHYHNCDYVNHDPVLMRCRNSMAGFNWGRLASAPNLTARQAQVLNEARDFGITNGATIPVHGPGGGFAILSVASSAAPDREFNKIWRHAWPQAQLAALYTHSTVESRLQQMQTQVPVTLTERERECLLWTGRGKTANEIGTILAISDETVVFHLKNAMKKIGVYSKHHAVVKAIMMGLIYP
jgi:DNA-binding CsgD family transcriptional regulator